VGVAAAIGLFALGRPVSGHEIGKTQVTATFTPAGTYQVDIVVDPDSLSTKLAVKKGEPPPGTLTRIERDKRIDALASIVLDAVQLMFDGVPARPHFEYQPVSVISDFASAELAMESRWCSHSACSTGWALPASCVTSVCRARNS
jgi:hypothetical protein